MEEAGASAVGRATADVIRHGVRKIGYLVHFTRNTENLDIGARKLEAAREDLIRCSLNNNQVVTNWLEKVNTVLIDARILSFETRKINRWYFFPSRLKLGLKVIKMIAVIQELLGERSRLIQEFFGEISRDFVAFSSWKDRKKIVDELRNHHVNIIGVFGMPGVGKTRLMQSITIHAKYDRLFDEVVTVTVQSPDIGRIQEDMAGQLDLDLSGPSQAAADLLKRLSEGQPKLIFLDDMWEELDLATVGIPLKNCKVLFTTRNQYICKQMKTDVEIEVGVLEEEEAWSLFQQEACIKMPRTFPVEEEIAKDIFSECNRVPLVILTLGSALRDKDESVWLLAHKRLKKINTSFYKDEGTGVARNLLMVSVARNLLPKAMTSRVVAEGNDFFEPYTKATETFEAMNLQQNLLTALSEYGCKYPSNIQKMGIVPFCEGLDVFQHAQSGLGRTITLCVGVLQQIQCNMPICQGLVLAPTLVMVQEIEKLMRLFGDNLGVKIHACGTHEDLHIVSTGVHVVVGTPVDFLPMLKKQPNCCAAIKMFVLDEADMMVSHGFKDEINKIIERLPRKIQVGVFAENISQEVLDIASELMNKQEVLEIARKNKPVRVQVQRIEMGGTLDHVVFNVGKEDGKLKTLYELVRSKESGRLVVFVNTRQKLVSLGNILKGNGYTVFATCSDMTNQTRGILMQELKKSSSYVVITTDLWARGIKFSEVPLIINYDLPFSPEQYRDRVIRVLDGVSVVNFVTADDWLTLFDIQSFYGLTFTKFKYSGLEGTFEGMKKQLRQQSINHYFFNVEKDEWKFEALEEMEPTLAIRHSVIFVNSLKTVDLLADKLHRAGLTVFKPVDMKKFSKDIATRESLKKKGNRVLITTELWPPGIDLEMATLVINYDMPLVPKKYKEILFRVGNNRKSFAKNIVFINFVTANDWFKLIDIQAECGVVFHCLPTQINDLLEEQEFA